MATTKNTITYDGNFASIRGPVINFISERLFNKVYPLKVDADPDALWDLFYNSFSSDEFKQFNNCNCCRHFIKTYGLMLFIDREHQQPESIWGVHSFMEEDNPYKAGFEAMDALVRRSSPVRTFNFTQEFVPIKSNTKILPEGETRDFDHFYYHIGSIDSVPQDRSEYLNNIPSYAKKIGMGMNEFISIKLSFDKISLQSIDSVLAMIEGNQLTRGDAYLRALESFKVLHLRSAASRDVSLFIWQYLAECYQGEVLPNKIRSTSLGSLLEDLTKGDKAVEDCIKSYEAKVNPTVYSRTVRTVSKGQVQTSKDYLTKNGYMPSFSRRLAIPSDLDVSDLLYVDRGSTQAQDPFESLENEKPVNPNSFRGCQSITLDDFISMPKNDLSILFEEDLVQNLFTLVAPSCSEDKPLTSWNNGFSFSYRGEVTSSISARVKSAGGEISGVLRYSLSWEGDCDLDLHCAEKHFDGNSCNINFQTKAPRLTSGRLDVDANASSDDLMASPVENICYSDDLKEIHPGRYEVKVNNYSRRSPPNDGFYLEFFYNGKTTLYYHPKHVGYGETVPVLDFTLNENLDLKISREIGKQELQEATVSSAKTWGLTKKTFCKVESMSYSPNHWGDNEVGTKHLFFYLTDARLSGDTRSIYTEFLPSELKPHRRVIEEIAGRTKIDCSKDPGCNDQVSGVGFLLTERKSLHVRFKDPSSNGFKIYKVEI